ncbi:MAG: Adaptive-response sensory-kinase SasA [Acidobacteria bacterium]|nr:Adaptive-response sensory-kinase SasA [Acidobacteriota bacterium]
MKLWFKTILVISVVLIAVFAVIAYFTDLATASLSDQQEREQTELLAAQVADTVRYHVRHARRGAGQTLAESLLPEWVEVREDVQDTIIKSNPQLAEARVFYQAGPELWEEKVKLPAGAGPPSTQDAQAARQAGKSPTVTSVRAQGQRRLVTAMAPVILGLDGHGPVQIGAAEVVLSFNESQSVEARLRRLVWPLMALAIITITLIVYLLFRFLISKPIDRLLVTMEKAEAGDLAAEVQVAAPDEIGLLTSRFNHMLGRIRQVTEELGEERRSLSERVRGATAEIEGRKRQLEVANRLLFEMQRQLAQLERLAATGQLAAQFAHEVGTPLNLISGHVQVLRARASDAQALKRLNVIAGQINRITGIVRSMLDRARNPRPRLEFIDINALLTEIFDAAKPSLMARGVELRTEMAEGLPPIEAAPDQLQQVFLNLINNGLDAMPAGGALSLSTKREANDLVIELADTGEGIAEDRIELIFDPFFTTKRERGTGLGLTIVKQIVAEHGGRVEVESAPGRGTSFRIRLPISTASDSERCLGDTLATARDSGLESL